MPLLKVKLLPAAVKPNDYFTLQNFPKSSSLITNTILMFSCEKYSAVVTHILPVSYIFFGRKARCMAANLIPASCLLNFFATGHRINTHPCIYMSNIVYIDGIHSFVFGVANTISKQHCYFNLPTHIHTLLTNANSYNSSSTYQTYSIFWNTSILIIISSFSIII